MVKRYSILYLILFVICICYLHGCVVTKTKNLTYKDTYKLQSDIIQTDGYYYKVDTTDGIISAFIFFKNGYLYHGYFRSHEEIKKLFYRTDLKENKYSWGVYRIDGDIIKTQFFSPARGNELQGIWEVIEEHGKIENKNNIVFYKSFLLGKERLYNIKYEFYKMNVTPDSTNWLMEIKK